MLMRLKRWLMLFLASTRLSLGAVCEASKGRGLVDDFHTPRDSERGRPTHRVFMTCRRCGKEFFA